METTTATYDGEVLRPDKKLHLNPGDRVRVTVELEEEEGEEVRPYAWLQTLKNAQLEGPPDASERVNDPSYVLGEDDDGDDGE